MWEDWAANQNLVVVEEHAIDFDENRFGQQSSGTLRNIVCGNRTRVHERVRKIPAMIKHTSLAALSVDDGLSHHAGECPIVHERMGSQGYKEIASGSVRTNLLLKKLKHQRHWHGARAIGDD